jgi:hypothetical protein
MWIKRRQKLLENLHPSLKGKVDFQFAKYRNSYDRTGMEFRILYNKEVVFKIGNWEYLCGYYNCEEKDAHQKMNAKGLYDDYQLFEAFDILNSFPIEKILTHESELVRMFALLDKRVGKRTLTKINIENEHPVVQKIYKLRIDSDAIDGHK